MDCPKWKKNALITGLPNDAMVEILSRAPARSVYRSKCVAKAWRDLIDDPFNRRKLPQTLQGFFSMGFSMCNRDSGAMEHCSFINYLKRSVPLDIDPCFAFLMKLPKIESLYFVDSYNGLLLFKNCQNSDQNFEVLGYIVCNPATKRWGTVLVCGLCLAIKAILHCNTFLAFDPTVSSQFHLIQFCSGGWDEERKYVTQEMSVHTYSSETGMWNNIQIDSNDHGQLEGWRHPDRVYFVCPRQAFVNGILHLLIFGLDQNQIVALDEQGKTKRMITLPVAIEQRCWKPRLAYIGHSQGLLHYINLDFNSDDPRQEERFGLYIWVLQNYTTQEWVLKDTFSFLKLFGRMTDNNILDIDVIAIHPDCNVVFFLLPLNKLIAYDMDRKEVSVVATFFEAENWERQIVPYIPCFLESPALTYKN